MSIPMPLSHGVLGLRLLLKSTRILDMMNIRDAPQTPHAGICCDLPVLGYFLFRLCRAKNGETIVNAVHYAGRQRRGCQIDQQRSVR